MSNFPARRFFMALCAVFCVGAFGFQSVAGAASSPAPPDYVKVADKNFVSKTPYCSVYVRLPKTVNGKPDNVIGAWANSASKKGHCSVSGAEGTTKAGKKFYPINRHAFAKGEYLQGKSTKTLVSASFTIDRCLDNGPKGHYWTIPAKLSGGKWKVGKPVASGCGG